MINQSLNVQMVSGKNPETISNALSALLIGRDLERIADLSTNISEDIIYMLSGEVTKHSCNINSRQLFFEIKH